DGVGLAPGLATGLLGLGLRGDLDALLLDFLRRQLVLGEAGEFLLALGDEDGLLALGGGDIAAPAGFGPDFGELGVAGGHLGSAGVLPLDRASLGLGDTDALLLLGELAGGDGFGIALGDRDLLVAARFHLAGDGLGLEGGDCHALLLLGEL